MRSEASASSELIVFIPYGSEVYVNDIVDGWAQVAYGTDYVGYCIASNLSFLRYNQQSNIASITFLQKNGRGFIARGVGGNTLFYKAGNNFYIGKQTTTYVPPTESNPTIDSQGFGKNFFEYACYITFVSETGSVSYDNTGIYVPYDPLSIGCIGFCASNAKLLILTILNIDNSTASYLSNYYMPNGQLLITACQTQSDTWFWSKSGGQWNAPAVSNANRPAMVQFLTSTAGIEGQNTLLYSKFSEYVSDGKKRGITNTQVMMYYCDLYNQNPSSAITVLGWAGNGQATLQELHDAAMRSNTFSPYSARRNKVLALCQAYSGQAPPETMPDASKYIDFDSIYT